MEYVQYYFAVFSYILDFDKVLTVKCQGVAYSSYLIQYKPFAKPVHAG